MLKLEEQLILPMNRCTVIQFTKIYETPINNWYLVAPNVGTPSKAKVDVLSSKIETNVKIIQRGTAVTRVCELEKTPKSKGGLTDEEILATLQHLYFRFLLGIGDSGTHNVLIINDPTKFDNKVILGNDMEENASNGLRSDKQLCLFRKPSSYTKKVYDSYIPKIMTFKNGQLKGDQNVRATHFNSL